MFVDIGINIIIDLTFFAGCISSKKWVVVVRVRFFPFHFFPSFFFPDLIHGSAVLDIGVFQHLAVLTDLFSQVASTNTLPRSELIELFVTIYVYFSLVQKNIPTLQGAVTATEQAIRNKMFSTLDASGLCSLFEKVILFFVFYFLFFLFFVDFFFEGLRGIEEEFLCSRFLSFGGFLLLLKRMNAFFFQINPEPVDYLFRENVLLLHFFLWKMG